MEKNPDKLEARRAHVSNVVNNYEGKASEAVEKLAKKLFLSKATIWRDLKSHSKDEK